MGGKQHAGCAEPTLNSARINKCFLQRMQLTRGTHALDCRQCAAACLCCQGDAARARYTVDQYGAGAAFARLATMLDAKIALIAQCRH